MPRFFLPALLLGLCWSADSLPAAPPASGEDAYAPHTPTLLFHLVNFAPDDADALGAALTKVASVRKVEVNPAKGYAQVRFDSHVVSYHQVAQAIAETGKSLGK